MPFGKIIRNTLRKGDSWIFAFFELMKQVLGALEWSDFYMFNKKIKICQIVLRKVWSKLKLPLQGRK